MLSALFIVISILFIIAIASEIFIKDYIRPKSLFVYLLLTTFLSGVTASLIIEQTKAKILP